MRKFKIKVGTSENSMVAGILMLNEQTNSCRFFYQKTWQDGNKSDITDWIALGEIEWDKSKKHPIDSFGYYTKTWYDDTGEPKCQDKMFTIVDEIKLERGF